MPRGGVRKKGADLDAFGNERRLRDCKHRCLAQRGAPLTRSITRGAATQYCCLGTQAANSERNGRRVWGAGPSLQEGGADSAGGGESDPCGNRLEPETQFGSV